MKMQTVLFRNKYVLMLISALLSAVLLVSMVVCGFQVNAWFRARLEIENPVQITNFVSSVEYSFDGNSWRSLANSSSISVTPDNIDDLRIRVFYKGESAGYLRVKAYSTFKNADTGTVLPQLENTFIQWKSTSAKWVLNGDYIYYDSLLSKKENASVLPVLTVGSDMSFLSDRSDYQDYSGEVYVIVDTVQPDRYETLWKIG